MAGRASAAIAVQEVDTESGRRLWRPLLDGAERLGVLGLTYFLARRRRRQLPA